MADESGDCQRLPPELDEEAAGTDSDTEGEDIFTGAHSEVTAPKTKKETVPDQPSRENGLFLEDDDQDLFAESTVKLSVDNSHNMQTEEPPKVSLTTSMLIEAASASAKPKQKSYEELEEEEEEQEQEDQFDVKISVTDPEKIGDGMNAYVVYRVTTQTNLLMFKSKHFTVKRRFSDFLGLYEKLSEKHSQNGFIIAPPPEKSLIGMTKVKVGKEDSSSAEFLERRRAALERYLQRIVSHPTLLQDPDVRDFLEKDELPRAVSTQALSGAGLLKMFNRATDAVNKMTIKMNESDAWFEDKFQEVECEEQHLRKLHTVVETLVNHRKELALNTALFAKSLAMLGSSEDNTALSRALSQLAEVEEKIEQLHQEQANSDFFLLAELLADYIRMLSAVRVSIVCGDILALVCFCTLIPNSLLNETYNLKIKNLPLNYTPLNIEGLCLKKHCVSDRYIEKFHQIPTSPAHLFHFLLAEFSGCAGEPAALSTLHCRIGTNQQIG
uniref:Sorting nexin 1 n=1 Tax=Xenopus tropicalis TaxID=8364 RepID=A0A6I8SE29_XENTR